MTTTDLIDRPLEADLRALRTSAPADLGLGALVDVGLADRYAPLATPLGRAFVAWNGRGVSWISAAEPAEFEASFRARVGRPIRAADALPDRLARAIERRLSGDRRARVPLDLRGHTPFEIAVWTKALEIPRGEVRPYAWIAAEIGRPRAVRAVGTALAHNPVPLVVPCHRVVRSDGKLGQYSMGGPDAKRRVLGAEGLDTAALEREASSGIRFIGSDTTHIVCHPTCRDARRVTGRHRVGVGSLEAAAAAGYRPCRHCRPVSVSGRAA
ncbi:MAG: methylated-DNA--[protein]-cysteine S-methyltransferase [Chloroflexi bacterium]|nr:methylated-DNA--[protein]-cysteine S-methyltransferase [Chloroflexota bacterium]